MTRFFRSTDEVLSQVNLQLDTEYGYPNQATKTVTTLPAASSCPHDSQGRVYLAVDDAYCDYVLPSQMLATLLASGLVDEVDEAQYVAVLPQMPE